MSKEDLIKMMGSSSHLLSTTLLPRIQDSSIVKIYMMSGECIRIKGDKNVKVVDVTDDYITVKFDSHMTDIMFNAIERVEYYGGRYGKYDN